MATAVKPRENRTALGVGIMALAVICYTCIDTAAKWMLLAGLAPLQVAFLRYVGHFILSVLVYVPQSGFHDFRSNAPVKQFIRSVLLLSGTILNFFALQYLPITFTTTIFFAIPIIVTLAAIPILGEQVGIRRIVAVCVGFFGVVITLQPWGVAFHPAMILSLCSLLSASGYFIMTRMVAGVDSNPTSQIWPSLTGTIALAPFGIAAWTHPDSLSMGVVMCLIGTFGLIGHGLTAFAARLANAADLAPIIYIQIFFASFVGVVLFDKPPSEWTLVGAAIIIASGLYIWHRERQKAKEGKG